MTIYFHCQYCAAPIEVDDTAAGKIGRCPKCAARLTVPLQSTMTPGVPAPVSPAASEPPVPGNPPTEGLPLGIPTPPVAAVPTDPSALLGQLPTPLPTRRRRPRSGVRKRGRVKIPKWLPAVVILLLVGGGVGCFAWPLLSQDPPLTGQVAGRLVSETEVPPVMLPSSPSGMSARQLEGVLSDLDKLPLHLTGDLLRVQIRGSQPGLVISVQPGRLTTWYSVDLRKHPGMVAYLEQSAAGLESRRKKQVDQAQQDFLRAMLAQKNNQDAPTNLSEFRDELAVPALVKGLGYHVVAKVGQKMYRCLREPEPGLLYFLLPPNLTKFEVAGRLFDNGQTPFPGKFTVLIGSTADEASPVKIEKIPANSASEKSSEPSAEDESETKEMSPPAVTDPE